MSNINIYIYIYYRVPFLDCLQNNFSYLPVNSPDSSLYFASINPTRTSEVNGAYRSVELSQDILF